MRHTKSTLMSGLVAMSLIATTGCSAIGGSPETFPNGEIDIVVPWGAGGSSDVMVRAFAEPFQEALGESALVVNRPGGGSSIGAVEVARAKADGYTMLHSTSSTFVTLPLRQKVKYQADEFKSVVSLGDQPILLVSGKDSGWKSLDDVKKKAKGMQKIAVTSQGNVLHLVASNFVDEIGLESESLPFDASSETALAVSNGDADLAGVEANIALPQIKAGEVVPLAVSSPERLSELPDVPTFEEAGYTKSQGRLSRVARSVPADTPDEVVDVLSKAGDEALQSDSWKEYAKTTALLDPEFAGEDFMKKFVPEELDWTRESFPAAGLDAVEQ